MVNIRFAWSGFTVNAKKANANIVLSNSEMLQPTVLGIVYVAHNAEDFTKTFLEVSIPISIFTLTTSLLPSNKGCHKAGLQ